VVENSVSEMMEKYEANIVYYTNLLLFEMRRNVGQDADRPANGLTSRDQLPWSRHTTSRDKSKLVGTVFQRHG